jgi:hypothetical protein
MEKFVRGKGCGPEWYEVGEFPLREAKISRISALYQYKLSFFKHDIDPWKFHE